MPFCNWCQLDSDGGTSCVWCKRPFDDKPSVFNRGADYQRLKVDDEGAPIPYNAILGLVVIAGLAVGGFFLLRPKAEAPKRQDLGWSVKGSGGRTPLSANKSGLALTNFPLGQSKDEGGWNQNPSNPSISSGFNLPTSTMHYDPITGDDVKTGVRIININRREQDLNSHIEPIGVYIEEAKFQLVEDFKGVDHLVGNIVVNNNMLSPLSGGRLWLKISDMKYDLKPYDGSVNGPQWLEPFSIPPKQAALCHVLAVGFQPWGPLDGLKHIGVDGIVASEPIHAEATIQEASDSNQ